MGVTNSNDLDVDLLAASIRQRLRKYPQIRANSAS
jgi:hypothetical protein